MGFFSLGKKEKKEPIKENKKEIKLNNRRWDRYLLNDKHIIDISKKGAKIKKENIQEIKKEFLEIKIGKNILKAKVIQDKKDYFSVEFLEEFKDLEFLRNSVYSLKEHTSEKRKTDINFDLCSRNDTLRAVINLLAELEDPNTTSEKMIAYIKQIPDLEQEILEKANSVEEKLAVEIKDLYTAIARLGFNRLRNLVRDIITKKLSLNDNSLSFFEYYEAFNIFKTIFFKETAPLFSFRDIKNEGRSLLSTETAIFSYYTNEKLSIKKFYKNPYRLYSGFSRILEEEIKGINILELGKNYFVDYLGFFKYLYDGYILAHLFLNPYLDLKQIKISLSQRKLRFGYVSYLTFLATVGVLQRDRKHMYKVINRLSRFGMDTGKVLEYINSVVSSANNALSNMGLRRVIKPASIPTYAISLKKIFPENIYFSYFESRIKLIEKVKRVCFRHEDRQFLGYILDIVLNAQETKMKNKSFCIIPCKNLEDEEIDIHMFEGFDIVIFKDIDCLPEKLYRDFQKLWKEFEGTVITTFSIYSFLDYKNEDLYKLLNPYIIDVPSFFNKSQMYDILKEKLSEDLDEFFEEEFFRKDRILDYKNESLSYILHDIIKTSSLFQ